MSDKPKKEAPPAAADDKHGASKKGGLLTKLPVLLGGAMVIEAVLLFAGMKMFGGSPAASQAVELTAPAEGAEGAEHGEAKPETEEGHGGAHDAKPATGAHGEEKPTDSKTAAPVDPKKIVELPVVEFRATNKLSGRNFVYDVSIYALVKSANKKKAEETLKERGNLIKDRVRTIIAQSDPEKLGGGSEPGLETLRRQVKYQLDEIVGEGVIEEVIVPRCMPFRSDF